MKTISDRRLQDAYSKAVLAGRAYANLCVDDAKLRIRHLYPAAAVVRFALEQTDDAGWAANLVTIRDANGELLWHIGQEGTEQDLIGDETTITDRLACAQAWDGEHFPYAKAKESVRYEYLGEASLGDLRELRISG